MARRAKVPVKSDEPKLDDLTIDSRVQPGKGKGKGGQDVIHGTITTLVREQILKDNLDRQKRASDTRIVLGKGGENLELFSKDIAKGYEQTTKDKLLEDKTKQIKDAKVLLKKVSQTEVY